MFQAIVSVRASQRLLGGRAMSYIINVVIF